MNVSTVHESDMKLSIVIVSYNVSDLLKACIESIYNTHGDLSLEMLVVDNASTDDSVLMVRQQLPDVKLIANETNRGFAAANNQAIRMAQGEYILLLNPDTIVRSGALHTLIELLERDDKIGIVGPKLLNPDGTLQKSCRSFPNLINYSIYSFASFNILPSISRPLPYLMESWDHSRQLVLEGSYLLGAAIMTRASILKEVGLLDEGFFVYGEEKDYSYRVVQAGYKIVFEPTAEIIHYGGQSSQLVSQEALIYLYDSHYHFLCKHYGWIRANGMQIMMNLGLLSKIVKAFFINITLRLRGRRDLRNPQIYWKTLTKRKTRPYSFL